MTQIFGVPLDLLSNILLGITLVIVIGVFVLAITNRIFFKIGVRNIPRRRVQMVLIIFALMLSTTLLSSALATGDVITSTVQSVAVDNLGSVDENVSPRHGSFFDDYVYTRLVNLKKHDSNIVGVSGVLIESSLLVADVTSRQVRSNVTGMGIIPGSEQDFGGVKTENGAQQLHIADLRPNDVYLNHTTAQFMNAHAGDTLYIYARRWPNKRYIMHVKAIVADGGLAGALPYMLTGVNTFRLIEHRRDDLTNVYVANRGGGTKSVNLSPVVEDEIEQVLPPEVHVIQVKANGVKASQTAQDIFSRIFSLFCLFALAIGLLLIFLIFVLLAAERRAEMGMARAIGVQRGQLVLMYVFEGAIYDLCASFVGLGAGVGLGALLVINIEPILARYDFPLTLTFQPRSLIISYCLGVIFTFLSIVVSSWLISRMTVADALRDLPESGQATLPLQTMLTQLRYAVQQRGSTFFAQLPLILERLSDIIISVIRSLMMWGILPLVVGIILFQYGLQSAEIAPFSIGLSLLAVGGGLFVRSGVEWWLARLEINRRQLLAKLLAAVVGLAIVAYWALPFDVLQGLGLPRFQGGIEIFFVAGTMMVLGATWALIANAELFSRPLLALCSWLPGLHVTAKLSSAYPLLHRFRTGLSVIMFSLVIFAMTVMVIIVNAMQNNYTNFDVQTGGYDIQATAYFQPIANLPAQLASRGINPNAFSEIGEKTSTLTGVIQLNSTDPAWHLYPAQVVNGAFLKGYGLRLIARAKGFESDSQVWQALQSHPNYALIDDDALPFAPDYNPAVYDPNAPKASAVGSPTTPPGLDSYFSFNLSGVYQGDKSFSPTPVWITTGTQQSAARKLTIIGVVDNSDSQHFGLYVNSKAYGNVTVDANTPEAQTYYFKVAPGQDKRALALALGSAFLDHGLETTVLEDAIWQQRGPRILISNVLLGMVALVLLFGMAALAITGSRAVIERRQQIGMLRALGCSRRQVESIFLSEALLVGLVGSLLGVCLGIVLARNIFAVDFFEQFHTGLAFAIPWDQIGTIVLVSVLASLLAALIPAWQAGRIAPTDALRY
jgi:putative ABC transport system permease protein